MGERLRQVRDWVFDLDNTLYPAACDLFAEIDARMTAFVAEALDLPADEARALQKRYYAEHGTTLKGLMTRHGLAPEAFLAFVHEIDLNPLPHLPDLRTAIDALPGRKFVFTNGARRHADRVTERLGLQGAFDGVFAIEDAAYEPKPSPGAYQVFTRAYDIDPAGAAFFEDMPRNLAPAWEIGFTTILVRSDKDWSHEPENARPAGKKDEPEPHIHYVTDDLTGFLGEALVFASETP